MMMMTKDDESGNNDSIFEGLSFPQVPVTPIVIQQPQQQHQQQLAGVQEHQQQQQQPPPQQQQQQPQHLNFSTLYITEPDITSQENHRIPYPELPTISTTTSSMTSRIVPNSNSSNNVIQAYNQYTTNGYQMNRNINEQSNSVNSIVNTMRSFVVGEPHSHEYEQVSTNDDDSIATRMTRSRSVEMQTIEHTSAPPVVARIVSNPIVGTVNQGIAHNNTPQQADNTLINNLIGENARLARENQLLKQRMEASGISVAPDVGDWVMERMQQPPQPPAENVKYVCCGRCRQWLKAPKEAVYVYCQTCDAINNCSSTIAREQQQQQQQQQNTILSRFLGPLENCFPGISSMTL